MSKMHFFVLIWCIYPCRISHRSSLIKYGVGFVCSYLTKTVFLSYYTVTTKHHVERLCAPWFKSKSKFRPCLNYAFIGGFSFASACINHVVTKSVLVNHPALGCHPPNNTNMFWTCFHFVNLEPPTVNSCAGIWRKLDLGYTSPSFASRARNLVQVWSSRRQVLYKRGF